MSEFHHDDEASMLETVIVPRIHDLGGGFEVRRALPHKDRRMVGPFVFLDQMGSHVFTPGQGIDVRPHPHIGLSTLSYLFDGEISHRDSLGTLQDIKPGEVNWMTAGKGIVHSERTGPQVREQGSTLFACPGRPDPHQRQDRHHGQGRANSSRPSRSRMARSRPPAATRGSSSSSARTPGDRRRRPHRDPGPERLAHCT
jgi:redox-sensitive bicupin YhaK (pirin superfamily)